MEIYYSTPLTAAQVVEHPEYPYTNWNLQPTKKGTVAVAKDRGGPINISYEVHGHGPNHMVVCVPQQHISSVYRRAYTPD